MATWQLQQAKAQFSALVAQAEKEGPQTITVHGQPRAVLLSAAVYEQLLAKSPSFTEHLLAFPKISSAGEDGMDGIGEFLERDRTPHTGFLFETTLSTRLEESVDPTAPSNDAA